MKIYKTKSGYHYKEYKSGKKKRISKSEYDKYRNKNIKTGGNPEYDADGFLVLDQEFAADKYSKVFLIPIFYIKFLNPGQRDIDTKTFKNYKVSVIKIMASLSNFMHIAVKFCEDVKLGETIIIKKDKQHIITSKKFMLDTKIVVYYPNMKKSPPLFHEIIDFLNELYIENFKLIYKIDYKDNISILYDQPASMYILQENIQNVAFKDPYKLHISINPEYLNEAIKLIINSPYYKTHNCVPVMKIQFIKWSHHYETNLTWNEFIPYMTADSFYQGIGYIVIYLYSVESLNHLSDFITFWKTNFEDNEDKYRDKNYIKFNTRLSKTLYFGYGGDTSSKLNNKNRKNHSETRRNNRQIDFFTGLLNSNNYTVNSKNKIKNYLKDTYSINYNENGNGLNDLEYWYSKNTNAIDLENTYGIFPYKYNELQQKLQTQNKNHVEPVLNNNFTNLMINSLEPLRNNFNNLNFNNLNFNNLNNNDIEATPMITGSNNYDMNISN